MGATQLKEESVAEEKKPDRVKVRTTFRPDQEVEMDQAEAEDLRRQGLIHEEKKGEKR